MAQRAQASLRSWSRVSGVISGLSASFVLVTGALVMTGHGSPREADYRPPKPEPRDRPAVGQGRSNCPALKDRASVASAGARRPTARRLVVPELTTARCG